MELRFDAILLSKLGTKILMRAISNVHAGHRFPKPGLDIELRQCRTNCIIMVKLTGHRG